MIIDPPTIDTLDKLIRMLGWPLLIGIIVRLVRSYDKGTQQLKDIGDKAAISALNTATALVQIDQIKDNHLSHLAQDLVDQKNKQEKTIEVIDNQTKILMSIDKGIAILADRSGRS
jgi:hypothetical protein